MYTTFQSKSMFPQGVGVREQTQFSPSPDFWLKIVLLQPHDTNIHQNVDTFCLPTYGCLPGLLQRFLTFLIWGPVRGSE